MIYLDVTFSERVKGTDLLHYSAPRSTGGVVKLYYESGSGSSTLRFSYKVKPGDKGTFTIRANSRLIDDVGNERVTDLHNNVALGIIPADITLAHPMNGDTLVNHAPSITTAGPLAFSLNENTPSGSNVGVPINASDPDSGDTITYSLTGSASAYFDIDSNGQITVGSDLTLDYESIPDSAMTMAVNISDGRDHVGVADSSDVDDTIAVTVVLKNLPEKPLAPSVTATTVNSIAIEVEWTPPDNTGRPPITGYEVKYNDGGDDTDPVSTATGTRNMALTNLVPDTLYYAYVRAVNKDGKGPWSQAQEARTSPNSAPISGDFTKEIVLSATSTVRFAKSDFHFEDPDTAHDPKESLSWVIFTSVPPLQLGTLKVLGRTMLDGVGVDLDNLDSITFNAAGTFASSTTFTFKVQDRWRLDSASVYTATIREVTNLSPSFPAGSGRVARSVPENSGAGTAVGDPVAATDQEGDTLVYSLTGADAGSFVIDSGTGQITVGQSLDLDYEGSVNTYSVTVRVTDNKDTQGANDNSIDASTDVTITVTNVVESPPSPASTTASVLASTALQIDWEAPDPTDGPPITAYSVSYVRLVEGVPATTTVQTMSAGLETSLVITGLVPNTQYRVMVWSTNSDGDSEKVTVAPDRSPRSNALPVSAGFIKYRTIHASSTQANARYEFSVSDFVFNDHDADEYSQDRLAYVKIMSLPNFLVLRLSKDGGQYQNVSLNESVPAADLDRLYAGLLHRDDGSNTFDFRVRDNYGGESTETYTIRLEFRRNVPPAFRENSPASRDIFEGSATGTAVGSPISADDRKSPFGNTVTVQEELTYSLSGPDAASFDLATSTGQLYLADGVTLDYEVKDLYTVTVGVTDGLDEVNNEDTSVDATIDVTINVTNLKEPPDGPRNTSATVLSSTSIRLDWEPPGNQAGKAPISKYYIWSDPGAGDIEDQCEGFTCPDPLTALTYTFTGLTPGTKYEFQVFARNADGQSDISQSDRITATTTANSLPTSSDLDKVTRPGVTLKFSAADFAFTDADSDTDSADSLKQVRIVTLPDSAQGTLKWTAASSTQANVPVNKLIDYADLGTLVFETGATFTGPATFTFKVADQYGGESAAHTATISYAPNLSPVFTQTGPVALEVAENSAGGSSVGAPVAATDPDSADTLTYTLSGDDASSFTIGANSGQIAVGSGTSLNYEAEKNTYALTVRVSDGRDDDANADPEIDASIAVNVAVTNVLEAAPAPTGVKVAALSPMSARVSWNAPDTTDAPAIVGYKVLYSTEATVPYPHASSTSTSLLSATSTTHTLDGLTAGTTYYFKVIARNAESGETELSQAAVVTFTAALNLTPTSADFTKVIDSIGNIQFAASDFAFTDHTPDDYLAGVKIVSVPDNQGVLYWTPSSKGLRTIISGPGTTIGPGELDTLELVPSASFLRASFTFRVVDSYGLESPLYTASLHLRKALITDVTITSTPAGDDNTYYRYETIMIDVTFDYPVSWAIGEGESIYVELDLGGSIRKAHLRGTTGFDPSASGASSTLSFDYEVQEDDTDTDGISVGGGGQPPASRLVIGGSSTTTGSANPPMLMHIGLATDASHKVNGDELHNARPQFSQDGAMTYQVVENSPGGTLVGNPIAATDADHTELEYWLEDGSLYGVDSNGQISVAQNALIDYESATTSRLTLNVRDGVNDLGVADPDEVDDSIVVNVNLTDVPEPPSTPLFAVSTLDSRRVRVDWAAPDTTGIPPITGWEVAWFEEESGAQTLTRRPFNQQPDLRTDTITGLEAGTLYRVQVIARNAEGNSFSNEEDSFLAVWTNYPPQSADFHKEGVPGQVTRFSFSDFEFDDSGTGDEATFDKVKILTLPESAQGTLGLDTSATATVPVIAGQEIDSEDLDALVFSATDDLATSTFTFRVADGLGEYSVQRDDEGRPVLEDGELVPAIYTATVSYPRARIVDVSIVSTPSRTDDTYYRSEKVTLAVTFNKEVTISNQGTTFMLVDINTRTGRVPTGLTFVIDNAGVYTGKTFNFSQIVTEHWGTGGGIEVPAADPLLTQLDASSGTPVDIDVWSATDAQGYDALLAYEGLPADDNHKYDALKVLNQPARFPHEKIVLAIPENSPANTPLVGAAEVIVTATLDGGTRQTATVVDIDLSGTASADDYRPGGPVQVYIPPNRPTGKKTLVIVPTNDDVTEGSETIVVNGTAEGFTVAPATLTLIDSPATAIDLTADPATLDENGDTVDVKVTATLGDGSSISSDTVVTISLGGTATSSDYTATLQNVTIPAGKRSGSATLAITPTDDSVRDFNETIEVQGNAVGFTVNPATITIVDWDRASTSITLSVDPDTVAEGAGSIPGGLLITATLDASPRSSDTNVVVNVENGTATRGGGADYTVPDAEVAFFVVIPAGKRSGSYNNQGIQIVDDSLPEDDETIVIESVGVYDGNTLLRYMPVVPATLTIIDDDATPTSITLSVSPDGIDEDLPDTVSATDPDDTELTYHLTTGAVLASIFQVASTTGVVSYPGGTALDYERLGNLFFGKVGVKDGKNAVGAPYPQECTPTPHDQDLYYPCDDTALLWIYVTNVVEPLPAPGSLTATSTSSTSLQVEWLPPADSGVPPVTGYRLSHAPMASSSDSKVVEMPVGQTSAVIKGLEPGREYEVRLQALNSDGGGVAAIVNATTLDNSAPDSTDFEIRAPLLAKSVEFATSSFPFSDPDSETHTMDSLHSVKIVSAPSIQRCSTDPLDDSECGARLSLGGEKVSDGDVIPIEKLDGLEMMLKNEWYEHSTFTFRVVDQYGAESPTYKASVVVSDAVVSSVSIVSTPKGAGSIYHKDETIEVQVDFGLPLRLKRDDQAQGAYIYLSLDIGGSKRVAELAKAKLVTESNEDTPPNTDTDYDRWTFSYTVTGDDVDSNGVSVGPDSEGNLVRSQGGAWLEHSPTPAGQSAGATSDSPLKASTPHRGIQDDPGHRVNGSDTPNAWPVFNATSSPIERNVAENSPPGTAVVQIEATDPDGDDVLTYSLSGPGTDADDFQVDADGNVSVATGAALDFEMKSSYSLTVNVSDSKGPSGQADKAIDDTIELTIGIANVMEEPPAPTNISATMLNSFSMRVDWEAGDNTGKPPITGYHVSAEDPGGSTQPGRSASLPGSATSTTLTDLYPNQEYIVTVRARNADGNSPVEVANGVGAVSPNPVTGPNTLPTSADFSIYGMTNTILNLKRENFPFTDPDTELTARERLSRVRIVTLPNPSHGHLVRPFESSYQSIDAGTSLSVSQVDSQLFFRPRHGFSGDATFTFKVQDFFWGESATATTATITVVDDPPAIESIQIVSTPYRSDQIYGLSDTIEIAVKWNRDVTWNIPEEDTSSFMALRLEVGGSQQVRWATPISTDPEVEEFPATSTARQITFAYVVQSGDLDTDQLVIPVHSSGVVQLFGSATLRDVFDQDAGRTISQSWSSGLGHRVNGQLHVNYRPEFVEDGPLTREVAENTLPGSLLGSPVLATDANPNDTLTYSLSGPDAGDFTIDQGGQIRIATTTVLDFEQEPNTYSLTVEVKDGADSVSVADNAVDDAVDMTVSVTNLPEPAEDVQAQVLSAHEIRVTWSAPDSANDNYVNSYELSYRQLYPKNPPFDSADEFSDWTTLTFDRDTRLANLEYLQPRSSYDIELRAVQKGVDAPVARVSPRPTTLRAPCHDNRRFGGTEDLNVWEDLHKYVLPHSGQDVVTIMPNPEYADTSDLNFARDEGGGGSYVPICDEEGTIFSLRDLVEHPAHFNNTIYRDGRLTGDPYLDLEVDTPYWYTLAAVGGIRGSHYSTFRLIKTTKEQTGITLSVEPASITESATATIALTAQLNDDATFHPFYDIALSSTFSSNKTFSATGTDVAIPQFANSATGEIILTSLDDEVVRGSTTVFVTGELDLPDPDNIFPSYGYPKTSAGYNEALAALPISSTRFTIEEDDAGVISIAGPPDEVQEGQDATFTVTLSHQVDADVTVSWTAAGGDLGEYVPTSGTVTFPANSAAGATTTITIAVTDDTEGEPAEEFTVTLGTITSDLSRYLELDPDAFTATATIADNDRVLINISGPAAVDEGDTAQFSVTLDRPIPADMTVDYTVAPVSGATADDYEWTQGPLQFVTGGPTSQSISVTAEDDVYHDPGEGFVVTISNPQGAGGFEKILETGSATTTINDDDDPVTVTFSVSPSTLDEGASSTEFTLTATRPAEITPAMDVALSLGGTAQKDVDYTVSGLATSTTLSSGATTTTETFTLTPVDDMLVEGDETIIVNGVAEGATVTGSSISLVDNDAATVTLSGPTSPVSEGAAATYTVRVLGELSEALSLAWETDFTPPRNLGMNAASPAGSADLRIRSGIVDLPAGFPTKTPTSFTVPIADDNLSETAEVFNLTIQPMSESLISSVVFATSTVRTVIAESDPISVNAIGPLAVNEGATSTYHVLISPSGVMPTGALSVSYATEDGTAAAGSDYTSASGSVEFTAANSDPKAVAVSILIDAADEGDETFSFVISNPSGGGGPTPTLGNSSVSTTITSSQVGATSIALSVQPKSISEAFTRTEPFRPEYPGQEEPPKSSLPVVVTATLSADRPFPWDTEITLSFSGTASSPGDYTVATTTVLIPKNQTSGTGSITMNMVDNAVVDGSRTVVVEGSAVGVPSITPATITITDDDQAAITLRASSTYVTEGSSVQFDARLSHSVGTEVTVNWSATSSDAGDYSPASGSVTFPANSRA